MEKFKHWLEQKELQELNLGKLARKAATGMMLAYQAFAGGDPAQAASQVGVKIPPNVQATSDINSQGEAAEQERKKRQMANSNLRLMKK